MEAHPFGVMQRRARVRRIRSLIRELELWEREGRGILASLIELSDPDDDLAVECRRLLERLEG